MLFIIKKLFSEGVLASSQKNVKTKAIPTVYNIMQKDLIPFLTRENV